MKSIYFFILFVTITCYTLGQTTSPENKQIDVEILKADSLVKGIYMSFKEFQENNPSIKADFCTKKNDGKYGIYFSNMPTVDLHILDTNNVCILFFQKHWGICDGKKVYVCFHNKYSQLSMDGKYCQYTEHQVNNTFGSNFNNYPDYNYVLNATNDDRIKVSVKSMEEILAGEDFALFNEYKQDENKKTMLYTYIDRLNKTYQYK